jgi:hypothetical protein
MKAEVPMVASRSRNTILLVQYNLTIGSRTFMEFETLAAAMDEICAIFERELKALNPSQSNMTYDIADLYAYIDQLCDISCLVYVCSTKLSVVFLLLILTLTLRAGTNSQYRRTFRGTRTGSRNKCSCIYGRQPQKASYAPEGPPERAFAGMPFALACGLERPRCRWLPRGRAFPIRRRGFVCAFARPRAATRPNVYNGDTHRPGSVAYVVVLLRKTCKRANDPVSVCVWRVNIYSILLTNPNRPSCACLW